MQIVLDILLTAVFALLVFRGWSRGLARSVLSLGRLILSFVVTALFGSSFARWINERLVNPRVYRTVFGRFSDIASDVSVTSGESVEAFVNRIPKVFRQYVELDSLNPSAKINVLVEKWSLTVTDGISRVVSTVLGFVLLFALSFLAFTIAIAVVGGLAKLPVIKTVDKLLGLVGGILSGIVAVFILSVILGAILCLMGHGEIVENSILLRLFAGLKERVFT
ncbi:MAG: CvpA family protein [Clostridia bacterium]|nr:CvpA family protein [Clostridia bacterium]